RSSVQSVVAMSTTEVEYSTTGEASKEALWLMELIGKKMKKLITNNALEFCNGDFNEFYTNNGIARHKTIPRNPQQNGVAERMNKTLLVRARFTKVNFSRDVTFNEETLLSSGTQSVVSSSTSTSTLQGNSEKVELIVKPTAPNVDEDDYCIVLYKRPARYIDDDNLVAYALSVAQEVNDGVEPANYA
ncbi:PREDICTED: uncharacterized protein LOC109339816, partial [Lupinus angustifolius]|uniref:uncharacterized protein LOC109339816 n=1 Tax=Lupinus angustifolius TaxID=3871 RepID=UPI00092F22DC